MRIQDVALFLMAIGYKGLKDYLAEEGKDLNGVFLSTAHPAKFLEVVEPLIDGEVQIPGALQEAMNKPKQSKPIAADFDALRAYLLKEG